MTLSHTSSTVSGSIRRKVAFTLMELLVVVAIIFVLAAIAVPVYSTVRIRANKVSALNKLQQLGTAFLTFSGDNDGGLPLENSSGADTWVGAADPASDKVWYNALPRLSGERGVGDYAANPRSFYQKDNILFLPGARYPTNDSILAKPLFAIAMNSKLQRRDDQGLKDAGKLNNILHPSRTIVFFENGLKGEKKASSTLPKYDGSPKGSARSFVARYSGEGLLIFLDGHVESVEAADILDQTGRIIIPQVNFIWTKTPEEDPN